MFSKVLPLKKIVLLFLFLILAAMVWVYPRYVSYLENVLAELPLAAILELQKEFLKKIVLPTAAILALGFIFLIVFWKLRCKRK